MEQTRTHRRTTLARTHPAPPRVPPEDAAARLAAAVGLSVVAVIVALAVHPSTAGRHERPAGPTATSRPTSRRAATRRRPTPAAAPSTTPTAPTPTPAGLPTPSTATTTPHRPGHQERRLPQRPGHQRRDRRPDHAAAGAARPSCPPAEQRAQTEPALGQRRRSRRPSRPSPTDRYNMFNACYGIAVDAQRPLAPAPRHRLLGHLAGRRHPDVLQALARSAATCSTARRHLPRRPRSRPGVRRGARRRPATGSCTMPRPGLFRFEVPGRGYLTDGLATGPR